MKMLRAATGANGTNLVLEMQRVSASKEQVLMGKKRKQLLVPTGVETQLVSCYMSRQMEISASVSDVFDEPVFESSPNLEDVFDHSESLRLSSPT